MRRILVILVWLSFSYSGFAQQCKPINIDGNSEPIVSGQRQNYLISLPSRLTKSQETAVADKMKELAFADYADDGCYVRAHVLSKQLANLGVTNIFKTWLFSPAHYTFFLNGFIKPKAGNNSWNYHVAVSFVNTNGTPMIMDPAVDAQKAITYDEWLSRLQCSEGSLMLRTDTSRWLPATVTTEEKIPKQDYYSNGRNPFNGFIFTEDKDTPEYVANHLSRDDVADKYKSCASVSGLTAKDLLTKLVGEATFDGSGCSGVIFYFKDRQQHWKSIVTKDK